MGGSIATSEPSCIESFAARPTVYDLYPAFGNLLPESHFQRCFEDTSRFIVFFSSVLNQRACGHWVVCVCVCVCVCVRERERERERERGWLLKVNTV